MGLRLGVCALGFVMLSRVLVRLGVGAIVLDDADPYVELDGQRVLLSFSGVAFCSRVKLAKLSVTSQRSSCSYWGSFIVLLLSRACRPSTLCGFIIGAWLTLFFVARGIGSLLEVSIKGGGGVLCLAVAGDTVWLCVLG